MPDGEYGEYGFTGQHLESLIKIGVKLDTVIERIEKLERRVEELQMQVWKWAGAAGLLGAVSTIALKLLWK